MQLIFCRHGETMANLEDKFQGVSDTELTEKGEDQARKLNAYLKSLPKITKFVISPFSRVLATYTIASQGIDAEVVQEPAIREMSYGNFEGKSRHRIDSEILEEREKDRFNFLHPGHHNNIRGDSYATLYERISSYLERLMQTTKDDEIIVVISHQGVMICVRKYFLGLSDKETGELRVPNDEVFIVTQEKDKPFTTSIVKL